MRLLPDDVSVPGRPEREEAPLELPGMPLEETEGPLLVVDPALPEPPLLLLELLLPELPLDDELLELLEDCSLQATSARSVIINKVVRMIFLLSDTVLRQCSRLRCRCSRGE